MTETAEKPKADSKRAKQGRSPSYPSVGLKVCLDKAKAQFDAEGKYSIPLPSAFKSWGYSEKSSGGRDLRASMRYFGVIAVEGDGPTAKVKLTDEALRVVLDEREDQTEKKALIRKLAMNPAAHKKLLAKFPDGIKSEATAAHYLVFDEGYNKTAAEALIAEFKETAAYAGIYQPDNMPVIEEPEAAEDDPPDENGGEVGKVKPAGQKPPLPLNPKVTVMEGERVAFTEESQPGQYLKLIASGEVDDFMLEALEDYVKRQRRRLQAPQPKKDEAAN